MARTITCPRSSTRAIIHAALCFLALGGALAGAQNLVAHYDLNEGMGTTALDSSSYGNDGTIFGASYTASSPVVPCPTGTDLAFVGGTTERVEIPDAPSLRPTKELTVEAWARLDSATGVNVLVAKQIRSGGDSYILYTGGGVLAFAVHDGVNQVEVLGPGIADGEWHHLAGVLRASALCLYLDGTLVDCRPFWKPIAYDSNPVSVGNDLNGGVWGESWNGEIDEVRIYDCGFSGVEVLASMTSCTDQTCPPPTPTGSTFCTAKAGLFCGIPAISSSGTPSASAVSGFTISAAPARGGKFGFLLYNTCVIPGVPFAQTGTLCVDPSGIRRAGIAGSGGTLNQCDGMYTIDMNAFAKGVWTPPPGAGKTNPAAFLLVSGTTVHTQFWGRDAVATGDFLSNGLSFTIQP